MNWKEIEEKCPNGFGKLDVFSNSTGVNHDRMLYDFFDENEIWVSMELEVQYTREVDTDDRNPHYVPEGFYYSINDNSYLLAGGGVFKSRTEAETAAFTKAFKILEEKLIK